MTEGYYPRTDKENDTVTLWSVGHNMPGYLPMADEPTLCTDWVSAQDSLIWEMESMLDYLSQDDEIDTAGSQSAEWWDNLSEARAYLIHHATPDDEYGTIVDDCPSGTSYWIVQETMTVAEATEYGVEL